MQGALPRLRCVSSLARPSARPLDRAAQHSAARTSIQISPLAARISHTGELRAIERSYGNNGGNKAPPQPSGSRSSRLSRPVAAHVPKAFAHTTRPMQMQRPPAGAFGREPACVRPEAAPRSAPRRSFRFRFRFVAIVVIVVDVVIVVVAVAGRSGAPVLIRRAIDYNGCYSNSGGVGDGATSGALFLSAAASVARSAGSVLYFGNKLFVVAAVVAVALRVAGGGSNL